MKEIKVLICDDSALMRRSLKRIIESDKRLKVIAAARNGEDSVAKARELNPDVITMDINMPGMDGITALQYIINESIAPVIMVSSLTREGAVATFESIALGAFDYVSKPGGTVSINMDSAKQELIKKIKAAARPGVIKKLKKNRTEKSDSTAKRLQRKTGQRKTQTKQKNKGPKFKSAGFKAVALGVSTGGPKTLFDVLPLLPADFPAPLFLVQHMPGKFITPFAERINSSCEMKCVEAEPGMIVEPGTIYMGRGDCQMILHKRTDNKIMIRTPLKPETTFKPSVDITMTSVLEIFGSDTIGVLMTGMGRDGAESMVKITDAGGITIAESNESAIVFGMPREAIERGGAKIIAPSWNIAHEIMKAVEY